MRGPVVLARDIRLGDERSIHEPIRLGTDEGGRVDLTPVDAPDGIWMRFICPTEPLRKGDPDHVHLCDYSSAGNTWNVADSDFRVWLPDAAIDPGIGP